MNLKLTKALIPNYDSYDMNPRYITIHNTANTAVGAGDEMHARYLLNGASGRVVSWHYTVDDDSATQHLPTNKNGWHAGDGEHGEGNRYSIGIEICENADGDFSKAVANAIELVVYLMKEHNIDVDHVVPHQHWSGKYCPRKLLSQWGSIKNRIKVAYKGLKVEKYEPQIKGEYVEKKEESKPSSTKGYKGNSIVDYLNLLGKDSSFRNRKKLAAQYGIKGYDGSPEQNLSLLDKMRSHSPAPNPSSPTKKGDMKTNSIVVYLNSVGIDSSFNNREKLAKKYGIGGYVGSADQNIELLEIMRDGKKASTPKPSVKKIDEIRIVGVSNAAYIQDRPDRNSSKVVGTIGKGKVVGITGSVRGKNNPKGYWEIMHEGKRAYISAQYGDLI
jgi:N-acetylmuramoyl-L-alanine amidase